MSEPHLLPPPRKGGTASAADKNQRPSDAPEASSGGRGRIVPCIGEVFPQRDQLLLDRSRRSLGVLETSRGVTSAQLLLVRGSSSLGAFCLPQVAPT
jgi:hypothetical protein